MHGIRTNLLESNLSSSNLFFIQMDRRVFEQEIFHSPVQTMCLPLDVVLSLRYLVSITFYSSYEQNDGHWQRYLVFLLSQVLQPKIVT